MEKWTLVGTQYLNFKDQKDQSTVEGLRLYCEAESTSKYIRGLSVEKFFCSVNNPLFSALRDVALPVDLEIDFNRNGKPSSYRILEEKKK